VGRADGQGLPRSSSTLLQLGGVEPVAVSLSERETGTLRESLFADLDTGLVVGRETHGGTGRRYASWPTPGSRYPTPRFRQQGRMKATATAGASELRAPTGGAVWGWPGSEPEKIRWSVGGATFTAPADLPSDELIEAIVELPTDPPPSTLGRLYRGLSRVTRWVSPNDRSEP
jgi:hypothetical protein